MPLQTWAEFVPTLIAARKALDTNQSRLAGRLGVAPSTISLWEGLVRTPVQENAEAWAEQVGVTLPAYATVWFNRKVHSNEARHGTRNGYYWHLRNKDMPACAACRKAHADYMAEWRAKNYREY